MSCESIERKLREGDQEELARLARLPELTLVSARELGQAISCYGFYLDTQEELFYTYPIKKRLLINKKRLL